MGDVPERNQFYPDESWRSREHLHRCPYCLEHKDHGGRAAFRCELPYLIVCAKCQETGRAKETDHAN